MARRGAKSKYDEYVKPRLKDIEKWAAAGATNKEICAALGIAECTLIDYKKKHTELSKALRAGRQSVVLEIKAALLKKALGFEYDETTAGTDKEGQPRVTVYHKYAQPDTTAAAMLLRNYDDTYRDKDILMTDIKQKEIELKRAIAEANNFDLNLDKE